MASGAVIVANAMKCGWAGPVVVAGLLAVTPAWTQPPGPWRDPSTHAVRFVAVEDGVRLEVLDWGGSGRAVVLLAGGGNTAHVFDEFAPKLATGHHVYGITRRGFGASGFSSPVSALDRLRDDVLAVITSLELEKPVLVGHSIAGAELSDVATSQPGRIAGLVYLEAGYPYAFSVGGPSMNVFQISGPQPPRPGAANLSSFSALQRWDAETYGFRIPEAEFRQIWDADASGRPQRPREFPGSRLFPAMLTTPKQFRHIAVPALVVFASPHVPERWMGRATDAGVRQAAKAYFSAIDASTEQQANALAKAEPGARVVRLRASHYVFLSHEQDTLRAIRAFLATLK
jgi:pimeloyl-ACP methyl ester carboxylesterase